MFGWVRPKKGKKKAAKGHGLKYAGSSERGTKAAAPDPGETRTSYGTDRGPLDLRDNAMTLDTDDGRITVPYHTIEAWEDTGKMFRVWWNDGGRDYKMSCTPNQPPAEIGRSLKEIIHNNTFEE